MAIDRTAFLVDGFNLYHSVVDASNDMGGASTKWLNIRGLCESYLHVFGPDNRYEELYYFSALAQHMEGKDPDTVNGHRTFIDCLKSTGVILELARFKKKRDSVRQFHAHHLKARREGNGCCFVRKTDRTLFARQMRYRSCGYRRHRHSSSSSVRTGLFSSEKSGISLPL